MCYWGTVEKTVKVISRSFQGQTVKDHKKDVFFTLIPDTRINLNYHNETIVHVMITA